MILVGKAGIGDDGRSGNGNILLCFLEYLCVDHLLVGVIEVVVGAHILVGVLYKVFVLIDQDTNP